MRAIETLNNKLPFLAGCWIGWFKKDVILNAQYWSFILTSLLAISVLFAMGESYKPVGETEADTDYMGVDSRPIRKIFKELFCAFMQVKL